MRHAVSRGGDNRQDEHEIASPRRCRGLATTDGERPRVAGNGRLDNGQIHTCNQSHL